jgi:hypothetical protein
MLTTLQEPKTGLSYKKVKNLLSPGATNTKTAKNDLETFILYMAPADTVKGLNLCPFASDGCKKSCLYSAGRGKFNSVKKARIAKTEFFRDDLNGFMTSLVWSILGVIREAKRKNLIPAIRLNGTSDIEWETIKLDNGKNIFENFPEIQFYDYTPNHTRIEALTGKWQNYHLTFSRKH